LEQKKKTQKPSPARVNLRGAKLKVSNGKEMGHILSGEQKQMLVNQKLKEKKKKDVPKTAQQSIPFKEMYKDGICRVNEKYFTKCIQFYDINYQLAQNEDKTATFEFWCDFYNYFDSSIHIQLSCMSQYANRVEMENEIEIPLAGDEFDDIREEYSQMLKEQLSKGNNGLVRKKYVTFGLEADDIRTAKAKLERVEADITANLKQMGVDSHSLSGYERLKLLYETLNPETQEPFIFNFDMIARTGLSSKDFIAPTSFDFRDGKYFRMGNTIGAVSYLQILAPELSDKMLADFLDMDNSVIVNLHVEPIDQAKAIKQIKLKITDLDKMKIEEQKKAVRSGYDMDVLPSDLVTYGGEAKKLLEDLQSRNERMFLVTVLVCNMAKTKQKLDNIIFQTSGVAQKYNCSLKRLDFQQEAGLMSSLPIGLNQIDIQRGLTTSATAIFVPFTTQELFQDSKEALYYGINAVSNNMIMADRKKLKNPNGLILGTPGCFTGDTRVRLSDGRTISFEQMAEKKQGFPLISYDLHQKKKVLSYGTDAKEMKMVKEIVEVTLDTGDVVKCTPEHWFLTMEDGYMEAQDLKPGTALVPEHFVKDVMRVVLDKEIPVYDVTVDLFQNFELECGVIVHNSGKSFSAKREITNCFFMTQDDICLCDPEGEYYPLVKRLHGQVIRISPNSTDYVNPMDINLDYSDDDSPISLKADFVLSLCELIIGGKNGLEPIEKTIIDRCVRIIYRDYLQHPVPENMPIMEDLYNSILAQDEPEAKRIATALEIYVKGSLNVFNHRTNVDVNNRIVCYDIKELGKQLKKIGMLVVQDQIWNRVTINRALHKSTRYYIDEFHLLLKDEQTASYSVEIWKRFRKWGGIPTGITQNVKDLLASREIENIFENSDFIYMLNQAGGDRQILAKQLNISPHQLSYVTNSNEGEGLLFYGNTIIPFKDKFPKDTQLYSIMTTKPDEVEGGAQNG
jgi:hypothetical protein